MLIIFFILGLAIGSFLNVLVYRLRVAETLLGRSFCPHCKKKISWYDNIPVISFVLLKFQCRRCKKKISWQYPLVEIITGIVFVLVGAHFFILENSFSWFMTGYYFVIASALVAILVYDFLYLEIPNIILWPAAIIAVIFNLIFDLQGSGSQLPLGMATISGILAAAAVFIFFFALSFLSREKWMGMGDAYLVILLGLILGWPEILLGIFLAFSTGAIYGIILISLKKKTMGSQVPFAPFLILGSLIALLYYQPLIEWYSGLFNFFY